MDLISNTWIHPMSKHSVDLTSTTIKRCWSREGHSIALLFPFADGSRHRFPSSRRTSSGSAVVLAWQAHLRSRGPWRDGLTFRRKSVFSSCVFAVENRSGYGLTNFNQTFLPSPESLSVALWLGTIKSFLLTSSKKMLSCFYLLLEY